MEKCPMKKLVTKIEYDETVYDEEDGDFISRHHTDIHEDFGDCTSSCAAYDFGKGCRLIRRS